MARAMRATWMASGGDFEPALAVLIEARKQGQDFTDAWPRAVAACDPDDRATLLETAGAWRLEFEGKRSGAATWSAPSPYSTTTAAGGMTNGSWHDRGAGFSQ
jgi:hypothetical protein